MLLTYVLASSCSNLTQYSMPISENTQILEVKVLQGTRPHISDRGGEPSFVLEQKYFLNL